MEDYKQRYEAALNKAKEIYNRDDATDGGKIILEGMFPELKESEDEKIRKWLIRTLKSLNSSPVQIDGAYEMMLPAIAWLEKQDEVKEKQYITITQKILDYIGKHESSFENGIPKLGDSWKVIKICKYPSVNDGKPVVKVVNEDSGDWMRLPLNIVDIKIEQKPADNIIEEEKLLLEKFKQAVYDCAWGKVTCKKEGETKEEYAERWAEQLLILVRDWADDYIDDREDIIRRRFFDKGKQSIQKPADKTEPKFKVKYGGGEYNVFGTKDIAGVTFYGIEDEPNHIDYVKAENCKIISGYAIKENGSPYPTKSAVFSEQKSAWSEEDENKLSTVLFLLHEYKNYNFDRWLKSLKERYTWKPSEEQMKALNYVVNLMASSESPTENDYYYNVLKDMRTQLKKLKE